MPRAGTVTRETPSVPVVTSTRRTPSAAAWASGSPVHASSPRFTMVQSVTPSAAYRET